MSSALLTSNRVLIALREPTAEREARDVGLLDGAEHARMQRLRQPADRRAFAAAHALLREVLSAAAPAVSPRAWHFDTEPRGKPTLTKAPCAFNLSHARELVAVAVGLQPRIGVDVETLNAALVTPELMRSVYGPHELADLNALQGEAQVARFYEQWVLKESWVKATGVGISDELTAFELRAERDGSAVALSENTAAFRFQWWAPTPATRLAVCVEGAFDARVEWWR